MGWSFDPRSIYRLLFAAVLFPLALQALAEPSARAWTVQDSIAVRYFSRDQFGEATTGLGGFGEPIVPSPDGAHFFFVYRYGDLASDTNVYELHVFNAAILSERLRKSGARAQALKPLRSVTLRSGRSDDGGAAIRDARWENNQSIVFLGLPSSANRARQIFRLGISSGALTQLTDSIQDVIPAPPSAFGSGSFVYQVLADTSPYTPLDHYPMVPLRGGELSQLLAQERQLGGGLYVSYRGGLPRLVVQAPNGLFGSWTSPDGKWAISLFERQENVVPPAWAAYELKPRTGHQFVLIDIEDGSMRPLLDAPWGRVTTVGRTMAPDVSWSVDSKHAVVVNTALPLLPNEPSRRDMSYSIVLDVEGFDWTVLEPLVGKNGERLITAGWLNERNELLVTHQTEDGSARDGALYAMEGGRWKGRGVDKELQLPAVQPAQLTGGLSVTLREGANTPPTVIASKGRAELALTADDAALIGLWRAPVTEVSWSEERGGTSKGGLMLPKGHRGSDPPPLVIQAYEYRTDRFLPDGNSHSAYAAQALVASGMAVLMIDIPAVETSNPLLIETREEGPAFVSRLDSAVAALAAKGLIDPERVGLIGFSRGGYMAYYAITHPGRTRLAAAIVDDAYTASYGEYIQDAAMSVSPDGGSSPAVFDRQYGGAPFWKDKNAWLDAPGFNVDRVATPTLFSLSGRINRIIALETVAAFRICQRPFDFLFFPDKAHQAVRPREKEALMEASVDWMSFWLLGKSSSASAKADRFAHWHQVRDRWESLKSGSSAGKCQPAFPPH
jgi:dipeptidyl aminopeptidase/acylaminoacyl peptidase